MHCLLFAALKGLHCAAAAASRTSQHREQFGSKQKEQNWSSQEHDAHTKNVYMQLKFI
jgi:hypothetical protein